MNGKLYVVATPIGNLADFTYRAEQVLREVDLIACEDTRVTQKLLGRYKIKKPLVSYHQHSKIQKVNSIIDKLLQGQNVALLTDAGTPGISDPGNKLVAEVAKHEVEVIAIPGPSAVTAALSISGLPTDKFIFLGFLPHKKGRHTVMQGIKSTKHTTVFYESVHRIDKALAELKENISSDREIVVARELTKKFETVYRGTIDNVIEQFKGDKTKGEFVVIVGPKK